MALRGFLFSFLLVLLTVVSGWCDCRVIGSSWFPDGSWYPSSKFGLNGGSYSGGSYSGGSFSLNLSCSTRFNGVQSIPLTISYTGSNSSYYVVGVSGSSCSCNNQNLCDFILTTEACTSLCEADSVKCVNSSNSDAIWNSANCSCDTLSPPDTTYRCQNTVKPSGTYGERPIAQMYRCVSSGSSSDQCVETVSLIGTCQQWGFCSDGEVGCELPNPPPNQSNCRRNSPTTTSTKCYYSCPDGRTLACTPTSTDYVAGSIYVGSCSETAPSSCDPNVYSPTSSASGLSSSSDVYSSSSSPLPPDTIDPGVNIDYTGLLNAIRDTLHRANQQREILKGWDMRLIPSVKNIEQYSLNEWGSSERIESNLTSFQERGFNLSADVKNDIDSSRSLLNEIKQFLKNDSLKTYQTDTTANHLLREINNKVPSDSLLTRSDSLKAELMKNTFKPYLDSVSSVSIDSSSLLSKIANAVSSLGRDSALSARCELYYKCLAESANTSSCFQYHDNDCLDGGSPLDGIMGIEFGILKGIAEKLLPGLFGDDTTSISNPSAIDTSVDLSGFSSASNMLSSAADSMQNFTNVLGVTLDSIRVMLDSAKKRNNDSVKVSPDSLWRDSSELSPYVSNFMLPGGTSGDCFVCHATLGTLGGLSDTSLSVHIDFSNFGGYNWCAIIRAVVRIATLVTVISLTLGSWAAAFGYNPKNDA